jgi:hypothetical protein
LHDKTGKNLVENFSEESKIKHKNGSSLGGKIGIDRKIKKYGKCGFDKITQLKGVNTRKEKYMYTNKTTTKQRFLNEI